MPLNVGIVDPSIVTQGVRESKIDLATPVNMYTSLRADSRAQKLSELTLSKEEKAAKREADLQSIIKSNLTEDGHIHTEKIVPALNRAGFVDEASAIQDKYLKASDARQKAQAEAQKAAGNAALTVLDSKDKVSSFLQFQKDAKEKNLPISEDVKNYRISDEEGHTGQLHPKIMNYLDYLGNESLSPEERLKRIKEISPDKTGDEFGMTPIYGKDAAGNIVALQTRKKGGVKKIELPEGITLTPGVNFQNVGDKVVIFDKAGKEVASVKKGTDPGKQSDLAISREELKLKQAEGMRKEEDANAKKIEVAKKARAYDLKNKADISSIQTFIDKIHKVKENSNMKYVTGAGSIGRFMNGTPAADLQADIDFLVSSGIIETLSNLKSQSPTGASGFGALSEKEMEAIKNAFSMLGNTSISPNKKREELDRVLKIMETRQREHRSLLRDSDSLLGPEPNEEEKFDADMKSDW